MRAGDVYKKSYAMATGGRFVRVVEVGERVAYDDGGRVYWRKMSTFVRDFRPVDMKLYDAREIKVTALEHSEVHSDAGRNGLSFECPVCSSEMTWAPHSWWSMVCDCGRYWSVELKATGVIMDKRRS